MRAERTAWKDEFGGRFLRVRESVACPGEKQNAITASIENLTIRPENHHLDPTP
jgi:hypothetical protein